MSPMKVMPDAQECNPASFRGSSLCCERGLRLRKKHVTAVNGPGPSFIIGRLLCGHREGGCYRECHTASNLHALLRRACGAAKVIAMQKARRDEPGRPDRNEMKTWLRHGSV